MDMIKSAVQPNGNLVSQISTLYSDLSEWEGLVHRFNGYLECNAVSVSDEIHAQSFPLVKTSYSVDILYLPLHMFYLSCF